MRVPTLKSRIFLAVTSTALLLCSCLGNSGSSSPPASSVQVYAGDGSMSVSWNADPTVDYWVFHAQDPTLSTTNWSNLLNAGVLVNVGSPTIVCGQINNPTPTAFFPATYFTINGRTGSAPGGAGSALVSTTPRPAGGSDVGWVPGSSIPAPLTALGYASTTPCGYFGRPASGVYVAVGPGGGVYYSVLTPNVAGPLSLSQGNSTMVWTRANTPPGFSQDLLAAAAFSFGTTAYNPGAASFLFVAVGKGGSILRSTDGVNWQQVNGVPTTSNLNSVAVSGSIFVAVGDGGVVLTSGDGLNWTLNTFAAAVSTNTLNEIHCVGATCVAVGTNGTTLWTGNSGGNWTAYPYGTNSWTHIAYGNNNVNADALVSIPGGVLTITAANAAINTWVVVDGNGNYAYANTVGGWVGGSAIAPSIVAIDYTSRFIALDASGNTYASENGIAWQPVGSSGLTDAVAMLANGSGYVAIGSSGDNASSF